MSRSKAGTLRGSGSRSCSSATAGLAQSNSTLQSRPTLVSFLMHFLLLTRANCRDGDGDQRGLRDGADAVQRLPQCGAFFTSLHTNCCNSLQFRKIRFPSAGSGELHLSALTSLDTRCVRSGCIISASIATRCRSSRSTNCAISRLAARMALVCRALLLVA